MNQSIAEETVRILRKNKNFAECCRIGKLYLRFYPDSNALKENIYLSLWELRNFFECYEWMNKINLKHEPEYIARGFQDRLDANVQTITKYIRTCEAPIISLVIDGQNKTPRQIEMCVNSFLTKCSDAELVHRFIIVTDQIVELLSQLDPTIASFVTVSSSTDWMPLVKTGYVLYMDDIMEGPKFALVDLLMVINTNMFVHHMFIPAKENLEIVFVRQHAKYFEHIPCTPKGAIFSSTDKIINLIKTKEVNLPYGYTVATLGFAKYHFELTAYQFQSLVKYKCFVINLDRRSDRMAKLDFKSLQVQRIAAIDGLLLKPSARLRAVCPIPLGAGVIGCALSHLSLYADLIEDDENDGYVIFEDDVVVSDHIEDDLVRVINIAHQMGRGLAFLSSVPLQHQRSILSQYSKQGIVPWAPHLRSEIAGGTGCYYISKAVARKVLRVVDERGIRQPIDMLLQFDQCCDDVCFCLPPIVTQYDVDRCSDVQMVCGANEAALFAYMPASPNVVFGSEGVADFVEEILAAGNS